MHKTIDFQAYKETGELSYIEAPVDENSGSLDSLEEISFVMEMSTDELISEVGCRIEHGESLRQISDLVLIGELSQRLIAIKILLGAYASIAANDGNGSES